MDTARPIGQLKADLPRIRKSSDRRTAGLAKHFTERILTHNDAFDSMPQIRRIIREMLDGHQHKGIESLLLVSGAVSPKAALTLRGWEKGTDTEDLLFMMDRGLVHEDEIREMVVSSELGIKGDLRTCIAQTALLVSNSLLREKAVKS